MGVFEGRREELWNAVTHGLGVLLSVAAAALLIVFASLRGSAWIIVGVSIFGATLIVLYTASTVYHAVGGARAKARLKVFDHASIYLLIAGTYTPCVLGPLRGGWGWSLFGVIWGLALAGVVFKVFMVGRFPRLSTVIYVAMGWLVLIAAVPLVRALPGAALAWLVAGGVAYTAGTVFYHGRRMRYTHAIWHLFVLAGSLCHMAAVAALL